MKLFTLLIAAAVLVLPVASVQAQDVIPDAGRMADIPGARETPDPALDYRIVFDIKTPSDSAGEVSPALKAMAGLVNTFRHNGVPAGHMHLAAVFHGPTIVLLADDATYAARTGFATNPNTRLLAELRQAGVVMRVCGQSAVAQHYDLGALARSAEIDLSATVAFVNLQTRGYVRVEE